MYKFIRPLLFALPTELSHALAIKSLGALGQLCPKKFLRPRSVQPCKVMGLSFPNPIGLAAGFDKNAECVDGAATLGFGFIEVGTVTPQPQPGNSRPRLFRASSHDAIINRLGFNNKGVKFMVQKLHNRRYPGVLGINIGKNATTLNEQAIDDYLYCFDRLYTYADYLAINLSSPNTAKLRELQLGERFDELVKTLDQHRVALTQKYDRHVPIVIKISPDLADDELDQLATKAAEFNIEGLIATNTTSTRPSTLIEQFPENEGGLSGEPLHDRSIAVIKKLRSSIGKSLAIIGVGGIMTPGRAGATLAAGADLLQVYTGMVYHGVSFPRHLVNSLDS